MALGRDPGPAVLSIAAAASLVAAISGLPLVWDGSFLLFTVLNDQQPMVIYNRFVNSLLTAPVLAASALTEDLGILRLVFNLSYEAVPFVALLASWVVVRRARPDLFVWPVLGIGLALLPGLAVPTASSIIAAQLFWPLFLAALVPPSSRLVLALSVALGVVVAFSHPIAAALLVLLAIAGWIERGRSRPAGLAWLTGCLALALLNVVWLTSQLDAYQAHIAEPIVALNILGWALVGPQSLGLGFTAFAAWLLYRGGGDPRARGRARMTIVIAALPFVVWAAIPSLWGNVIDFRVAALPCAVPLLLLAWLDARSPVRLLEERRQAALAAAVVMFVVVVVLSAGWAILAARVESAVAQASGCVPAESIEGYPDSALGNAFVTPLSLVLQGRDLHAFVEPLSACASTGWPARLPAGPYVFEPRWFRFR
ncbi:MAG TPA: hypothetical protein VEP48_08600 [Methylomirabilota bacterium]|nr:hypothetical protein [Methylomirabilota bacterium]